MRVPGKKIIALGLFGLLVGFVGTVLAAGATAMSTFRGPRPQGSRLDNSLSTQFSRGLQRLFGGDRSSEEM